jgi:hypothetical protein
MLKKNTTAKSFAKTVFEKNMFEKPVIKNYSFGNPLKETYFEKHMVKTMREAIAVKYLRRLK